MNMLELNDLPALNAGLNGLAGVLLAAGYVCIRRRWVTAHRALMGSAFAASTLFLTSYLIYHFHRLTTPFEGEGSVRILYFFILITHVTLAVVWGGGPGVELSIRPGISILRVADISKDFGLKPTLT